MSTQFITIPNGRKVSLGFYAKRWRELRLEPDKSTSVKGWSFFSTSIAVVLADMRAGLHDRINKHLPVFKEPTVTRLHRRLTRKVQQGDLKITCRWCGSSLPNYRDRERRFCDSSCRASFWS